MGNNSALSIGTEHIEVQKEIVSQTQLRDKITFGTQTNVPTVAPAKIIFSSVIMPEIMSIRI